MAETMQVVKRNGSLEDVAFEKVQERIQRLSKGLAINPTYVAQQVLVRIINGIQTSELDEITAKFAESLSTTHPDYGVLAARIAISNHQKCTAPTFLEAMEQVVAIKDRRGLDANILHEDFLAVVRANAELIESTIVYERDFLFDYFGFKTLQKAYLLQDKLVGKVIERPQHLCMRVAIGIWGSNLEKAFKTYELLSTKQYTHATPTLFNAGTKRPQLSSCFLVAMKSDSVEGIFDTLKQCAQISKYAGGIGVHIHNIRAAGSLIAGTNGTSDGIVPMVRVFNNTARYINQGGKRNGSFAIYLEPWHADVEAFLDMKKNTGAEEERARDLFYALWIPDLFMERVDANGTWTLMCPDECPGLADAVGPAFNALYEKYEAEGHGSKTISAQKLWFKILDSQIETGTPYLLYKDACNLKSNQQNLGTIKSSNLCVAPETLIYTKQGNIPIKMLIDKEIEVWNGNKWSSTTVHKTGESQQLLKVKLSNGVEIECTPYHKFIITESYYERKSIKESIRIEAKDLKPNMKLHKWDNAFIEGDKTNDFKYPYTHGFFCGDGTYSNGKPSCSLYGEKKLLISKLDIKSTSGIVDASGRLNTVLPVDLEPKFKVPINSSIHCRLRWLEGVLDADGSVARNGDNEALQIGSINKQFLNDIQIMLVGLGVNAKITKGFETRQTLLPDGKGGKKLFDCKESWRLLISSTGLHDLVTLGFSPHRLKVIGKKPQRCAEQYVYIVSVTDEGRIDDTYCFNEPENHAGMFNGILTGNCSEIVEYSSPEETAVCNLASMNLPAYVKDGAFDFKRFRSVVKHVVESLNKVIDINFYPIPEAKFSNMRHRPIGIGVQGLADVFALLRIPWESPEAVALNKKIFAHMYYAAVESSMDCAIAEGVYETYKGSPASKGKLQFSLWGQEPLSDPDLDWDLLLHMMEKTGLRNSLLIAPMPTASTAQILGNTESIEPVQQNLFTRRTLAGEFFMVNRHLVHALVELGVWSSELKDKILARNGSVQGLAEVPADLQAVFKTVWEIKQKTLIDLAADRAPYICQSQSLNLFISDPTYAKLTSMHFYAWRKGLKTGIYYLRTRAAVGAQKFTVEPSTATVVPKEEEKECTMCSS